MIIFFHTTTDCFPKTEKAVNFSLHCIQNYKVSITASRKCKIKESPVEISNFQSYIDHLVNGVVEEQ